MARTRVAKLLATGINIRSSATWTRDKNIPPMLQKMRHFGPNPFAFWHYWKRKAARSGRDNWRRRTIVLGVVTEAQRIARTELSILHNSIYDSNNVDVGIVFLQIECESCFSQHLWTLKRNWKGIIIFAKAIINSVSYLFCQQFYSIRYCYLKIMLQL